MNKLKIPAQNFFEDSLFTQAFDNNSFSSLDDMGIDFNEEIYHQDSDKHVV